MRTFVVVEIFDPEREDNRYMFRADGVIDGFYAICIGHFDTAAQANTAGKAWVKSKAEGR